MKRHPFDIVPVLTGALFVLVGATYALADLRDEQVRDLLLGGGVLTGLALMTFVSALRAVIRSVRGRQDDPEAVPGEVPGTEVELSR